MPAAQETGPEPARGRWFGLWDGYFAVSYVVTVALLLTSAWPARNPAVAVAALTVVVPWYAGFGRRLMVEERTLWPGVVFATGLYALFVTAMVFHPAAVFALFGLTPMLIMSL